MRSRLNFKTVIAVAVTALLMTACVPHRPPPVSDATLGNKIVGTWTTSKVTLPDTARLTDVRCTFQPDGTWTDHYTVTRDGNSKQQTTAGVWRVQAGYVMELQTTVNGVAFNGGEPGASRILKLTESRMVLSNELSPRRVFSRVH